MCVIALMTVLCTVGAYRVGSYAITRLGKGFETLVPFKNSDHVYTTTRQQLPYHQGPPNRVKSNVREGNTKPLNPKTLNPKPRL